MELLDVCNWRKSIYFTFEIRLLMYDSVGWVLKCCIWYYICEYVEFNWKIKPNWRLIIAICTPLNFQGFEAYVGFLLLRTAFVGYVSEWQVSCVFRFSVLQRVWFLRWANIGEIVDWVQKGEQFGQRHKWHNHRYCPKARNKF